MIAKQTTTGTDRSNLVTGSPCAAMMRPDTLDPVIWATAFLWGGAVWLTHVLGYLQVPPWPLFFAGAGALVLVELAIRLLVPIHRRDLLGTSIWAAILLGLGTGRWGQILSLAVIAIGLIVLIGGVRRRT